MDFIKNQAVYFNDNLVSWRLKLLALYEACHLLQKNRIHNLLACFNWKTQWLIELVWLAIKTHLTIFVLIKSIQGRHLRAESARCNVE